MTSVLDAGGRRCLANWSLFVSAIVCLACLPGCEPGTRIDGAWVDHHYLCAEIENGSHGQIQELALFEVVDEPGSASWRLNKLLDELREHPAISSLATAAAPPGELVNKFSCFTLKISLDQIRPQRGKRYILVGFDNSRQTQGWEHYAVDAVDVTGLIRPGAPRLGIRPSFLCVINLLLIYVGLPAVVIGGGLWYGARRRKRQAK
jgi:hypothetical protein